MFGTAYQMPKKRLPKSNIQDDGFTTGLYREPRESLGFGEFNRANPYNPEGDPPAFREEKPYTSPGFVSPPNISPLIPREFTGASLQPPTNRFTPGVENPQNGFPAGPVQAPGRFGNFDPGPFQFNRFRKNMWQTPGRTNPGRMNNFYPYGR